jgi:hypothetical protein
MDRAYAIVALDIRVEYVDSLGCTPGRKHANGHQIG